MDVDNLLAGQRFDRELEKALAQTDVFLAVIGARWLDLMAERAATAERDFVREEIAGALARGIIVIPVLIERATLPRGDALAPDIRALVLHHKQDITHERFGRDVEDLIAAINAGRKAMRADGGAPKRAPVPWGWIGASATAALAVAWVAAYWAGMPVPGPRPSAVLDNPPDLAAAAARKRSEDDAGAKAALEADAKRRTEDTERQRLAARMADEDRQRVEAKRQAELTDAARRAQQAETAAPSPAPFRLSVPKTVKLQNSFASSDPVATPAMNQLVRDLGALSQGTLRIDALAAGAVVSTFQLLDAVHGGILDAAWSAPGFWYGKHKSAAVLEGRIPFGLEPAAFVRWLEGDGAQLLNQLYADQLKMNVRAVPCGLIGRGGDWYKQTISRPSDIQGLKFRAVGFAADVSKNAGSAVAMVPAGELVPALDRGIIDGASYGTPAMDLALGLPDVLKVMHFPGWAKPVTLIELLIGEKTWGALGREGQQGVSRLCGVHLRRALQSLPQSEAEGLDRLRSRGVRISPYPADVSARFRSATDAALSELRKDAFTAKVLASYAGFR